MSYFKAKMHQIRLRLGLRPRPPGGAYSAPQTLNLDLRGFTSKGREGRKDGKEEQGRGKGSGWDILLRQGEEMGEKGRGGLAVPPNL